MKRALGEGVANRRERYLYSVATTHYSAACRRGVGSAGDACTMILTTTPTVDGKTISGYLGIVTGEAIVGANIFRDLFANIRDIVGGRSAAYEQELARARNIALEEIEAAARQRGADAVVGIDLDYEVLGANNGMLMVSVSGTAVRLG
jgi:uncharacterized protein YbjQ (UPF0145 family)